MNTNVYVCTGGCGAVISQEQFDKGLQACGADGCDHKGIPFEKITYASFLVKAKPKSGKIDDEFLHHILKT